MIHQLENVSLKDTHGVEYTAVKLEHAFREFVIFGTLGALFEAVNSALNLKKEGKCPANSANALAVRCKRRFTGIVHSCSLLVQSKTLKWDFVVHFDLFSLVTLQAWWLQFDKLSDLHNSVSQRKYKSTNILLFS